MLMNTRTVPTRPFLKWAGNKFRLLDRILARLPGGGRLIEPFLGSGALFLNTGYRRYLLSDSNQDLIDLYQMLKQEGPEFIKACSKLFRPGTNNADAYYRLRTEFNACTEPRRRAVLFVYLNRHGYNGLCRYNSKGGFNVPFGRYKHPYFPEKEMLLFHDKARRAVFRHEDFIKTMARAKSGDVVYCDPPYVPLSPSSNFTAYSAGGFTLERQRQLAGAAAEAAQRGVPVLISNHDTAFTRDIYTAAGLEHLAVQRYISCQGHKRQKVGELLALYQPPR